VVIALRPSAASFTYPALIALLGSMFFAVSMITTRVLRGTSDTMLVATQTLGTLLLGALAAPFGWVTPSLRDLLLLCLLGVVALVAHACTNRSLKLAPASVVVPYQYTLIVWAILFGWLVFNDVPALLMLLGAAIIVAAGLFIFLREQAAVEEAMPPEAHP
jgi:drug/metabolite transporter (DMT)-like permease